MDRAEFDKFADEYRDLHAANLHASGEPPEFFAEYKIEDVSRVASALQVSPHRILDFGAGIGNSVPYVRSRFPGAGLTCLDVSERSLAIAGSRFPGEAQYQVFDGEAIPFPDRTFDIVFTSCVFHHINASEHVPLLREIRRVLTPQGVFFLFEHNPLNPLTVRAVADCPFDENAVLISASRMCDLVRAAGYSTIDRRYRIFFPRALRLLRPLEAFLNWCPIGAQYSIAARR